jgi:hypothetical protein
VYDGKFDPEAALEEATWSVNRFLRYTLMQYANVMSCKTPAAPANAINGPQKSAIEFV